MSGSENKCNATSAAPNGDSGTTILTMPARFPASYWQRRFICERSEHERTKTKLKALRIEIAALLVKQSNSKGA